MRPIARIVFCGLAAASASSASTLGTPEIHDLAFGILKNLIEAETISAHGTRPAVQVMENQEFAILFPGASAEQALEVVERIRADLAQQLLAAGGVPFTASFGIADSTMDSSFAEVSGSPMRRFMLRRTKVGIAPRSPPGFAPGPSPAQAPADQAPLQAHVAQR